MVKDCFSFLLQFLSFLFFLFSYPAHLLLIILVKLKLLGEVEFLFSFFLLVRVLTVSKQWQQQMTMTTTTWSRGESLVLLLLPSLWLFGHDEDGRRADTPLHALEEAQIQKHSVKSAECGAVQSHIEAVVPSLKLARRPVRRIKWAL